MRALAPYLAVCAIAAAAPLLPRPSRAQPSAPAAPTAATPVAWPPTEFEGRKLTELPLTGRDRRFADDFPGRVGRFTDGTRELIMRTTDRATRRLHPASDCLKATGFTVEPLPARRGPDGTTWGCIAARKQADALTLCEQIRDADGRRWPDPSSWYWPALTGASRGPWWSTTIVEKQPPLR
jgi:hypothetical protein